MRELSPAGRDAPAAYGERTRRVHDHGLAAVDVALVPWPGLEAQRAAIDRDLASVVAARLCAIPTGGGVRFDVTLDKAQAGHAFPSGVTHARRAWVHPVAEVGARLAARVGIGGAVAGSAGPAGGAGASRSACAFRPAG